MKYSLIKYIYILLAAATFVSCQKGDPLHETKMVNVAIATLFQDSPAMDVYMNEQLIMQLPAGIGNTSVLMPEDNKPVHISITKKGDKTILRDTTFPQLTTDLGLTYMYNETLGFNQFTGADIKKPSPDSCAVQFFNKFNYGSHKQNIYIYKSPTGTDIHPENIVDSIVNLDYNQVAGRVITLPAFEADGVTPILYSVTSKDAVTGYDGIYEYMINNGLDPAPYGGFPITGSLGYYLTEPGKLTIVNVVNYPYDENGIHYEQLWLEKLFTY